MRLPLAVLLLLAVCAHAELFHVRVRAPAPELTAMAGVQEVGDDARLFLVDADDEHALAAQMNAAVTGQQRRFDGASVVIARVQPVAAVAVGSWGQDRIDQRALPLDSTYAPLRNGAGVTAWVVDTGVDAGHAEFAGGRASNDFSVFSSTTDCHGHGTHVASTLAGAQYGVAPAARVRAIKVLDCSGSGSTFGVAQGLAHVLARLTGRDVINLSLGYSARDAVVESVIADLRAAGAIVVAAAGNSNGNACNHFPSAHVGVLSVAATTSSDARASFSNFGSCVSLFAPGSSIRAAARGGGSTTMSGTSMAAPHVAGVVAQLLETVAPGDVVAQLLADTTPNAVSSVAGSPNRLLYTPSAVTPSATRAPASASPTRAGASASRTPSRTPKASRTPSRTPRSRKSDASAATRSCVALVAVLAAFLFF
jgi:subtilisin family serine protease